jgi:hypothetical protein
MRFQIAVEDMEPDHWIAWILDLPGCYSSARTSTEAIIQAPASIALYFSRISKYNNAFTTPQASIDIEVAETFQSFPSERDPEYIVNAFFEDDKRPVRYGEAVIVQLLLDWSREELLQVIRPLDERRLNQPIPGEVRGSIAGIIEHIAGAENWYFGMFDLALDRSQLPENPLEKLAHVRRNAKEQLWNLISETRITGNCDELWSARKVIRRTLWHERDHAQHIERLLKEMS